MMEPLVSVRIATYNHEKYIAQCIESILMQRATFSYEIIVGEDCSTDGTREIVFDYAERFPEVIRVVTSENNVGPQENFLRINQACRGRLWAICEGDDYWIDPLKLQKQADFLGSHPETTMCFHNAFWLNDTLPAVRIYLDYNLPEILTMKEMVRLSIPTASMMVRKEVIETLPEWRRGILSVDRLVSMWCAHLGNVGFIKEIMSVYRKHPEGVSSKIRKKAKISGFIHLLQLFDQETERRYTDLIQPLIKQNLRRKLLTPLYQYLYSDKIVTWLQKLTKRVVNWK
jgi:glycosyltransferase involved in cell wall biosynthesis